VPRCPDKTGANSICTASSGDHIWWISDLSHFQEHYPTWQLRHDVPGILKEIYERNVERWSEQNATEGAAGQESSKALSASA
jgi:hypothetical protein